MHQQPKPETFIALIDCESFYASCERVFDATLDNKFELETLLCLSSCVYCCMSGVERAVQMTGDVAFDAAADLSFTPALFEPFLDI